MQDYVRRILTSSVYEAAEETPLEKMELLSARLGTEVLLKREDMQPVFSFKIRGAHNRIAQLTAAERELLLDTVRRQSPGADWIACCGSLPRGLAPSWYAELVARVHAAGVRVALDTSGPALLAALRERPDVVKPNAGELAEAVGRPLATVGDALKAAEELRGMGARAVLASLGADGQLLAIASGAENIEDARHPVPGGGEVDGIGPGGEGHVRVHIKSVFDDCKVSLVPLQPRSQLTLFLDSRKRRQLESGSCAWNA